MVLLSGEPQRSPSSAPEISRSAVQLPSSTRIECQLDLLRSAHGSPDISVQLYDQEPAFAPGFLVHRDRLVKLIRIRRDRRVTFA